MISSCAKPLCIIPRPARERLPKGEVVTIAAGFLCPNGLVLCADTEELYGEYKFRTSKLIVRPEEEAPTRLKAVFAGAGDGSFIDKIVAEMWRAAQKRVGDIDAIVGAMEDAVIRVHQKYWPIYHSERDRPEANVLFGVVHGGQVRLAKSSGPIVNPVTSYELTGVGHDLARYIAERAHEPTITLDEAAILATYILVQTKRYVEGCGGDSHIVIVNQDGNHRRIPDLTVTGLGATLDSFDHQSMELMLRVPNARMSDTDFENRLAVFTAMMRALRTQHKRVGEAIRKALSDAMNQSDRFEKRLDAVPEPPEVK